MSSTIPLKNLVKLHPTLYIHPLQIKEHTITKEGHHSKSKGQLISSQQQLTSYSFSYLHDVYHYDAQKNGIASAIPTVCLFFSKLVCSYLNTWLQKNTSWSVTKISKVLNGVGSAGLALFMVAPTFLDETRAPLAVVFLSLSMMFTGMHTPGCQAALVAVAPAYR